MPLNAVSTLRHVTAVSAVILAHRRKSELNFVLDRLAELPVDEVIVVNNGPPGELGDVTSRCNGKVNLLEPGRNTGIAGRNLAAQAAKGELLPMLDDDSYPLPGAVEALVSVFQSDPQLGVAGGLVRDVDARQRIVREDQVGTFDWFFRGGRKGEAPQDGWPTFFFPEGACMIRRRAFLEVKGFFEPYFFATVEVDLATRLVAAGWDVRYVRAAVFDHLKAQSGRVASPMMLHYRVRNQLWYFWLYFPPALAARRMAAYLLFDLIECTWRGAIRSWASGIAEAWRKRDVVRPYRKPLSRDVLRRAELNRGRMHVRLLYEQLRRKRPGFGSREAPPQPPSEMAGRILRNTVYRTIADVGSKIASVALFVVMARKLGDAQFGIFTFGLSFVTLVTTLGGFGQDVVLTREVARERRRLDSYFADTIGLKLLLALPALLVATLALWAFGSDAETRAVVGFLGLAVTAELLTNTCFAVFQAYERLGFIPVALIFQRFVTAIAGVVALALGADVVDVSLIYLWGAVLALLLALTLQFHRVVRPRLRVDLSRWWPLMRAALPVGLFSVFAVTLFRIDTAMLAGFRPKSVVGQYGVAYRLLETTLFLSWGVGAAIYPVLSRLTRDSAPPIRLVFERAVKLVVALTLPLAVGAAVLAGPLIRFLYGPDFDDAGPALVLLAPTIALYPIAYISGNLLLSQDRQAVLTKAYGVIAVQNILSNLVLIPWLSLYGAALGTSISQLILSAWLVVLALRTTGQVRATRMLAGPLTAGAAAALAMGLLHDHFALAVAAGAVSYAAALTVFEHVVYPEDARTLRDFVQRRRG
jgi:O-antigen/teichoic acid export membrane protein/GT2 family glycosyltransferase